MLQKTEMRFFVETENFTRKKRKMNIFGTGTNGNQEKTYAMVGLAMKMIEIRIP